MGAASDDDETRQRVRDAILKAGGVPRTAAQTGIPAKTLENYLAKRSMPSLANAHRIAYAAGIKLEELVGEVGKRAGAETTPQDAVNVFTEIFLIVDRVHREFGARLTPSAAVEEAQRHFSDLQARLMEPGDPEEARSLLPWVENRVRAQMKGADAEPGTGKREAS